MSETGFGQATTDVSYQTNPRVTETNVYDSAGNRNRGTVSYTSFSLSSGVSCSLPSDAYQYAADATMVLRRSHTDYNLSSTYLDRRIIGLTSSQTLFDGANSLMARTDLLYDETGSVQNQGTTTQHDDTNYGSGYVAGRANVSSGRRYDVINSGQSTVSSVQYNTAGAVVTATDPAGHQSSISYADSFSDGNNSRNTFAYPTTITDADGFSSSVQYNYDFGAQTRTQGPPPAGQAQGVIQTITYDSAARVDRVTTTNTGAYTRYIYGPYYVQSWSSVNNPTDEAYSIQTFDGVGRVIGAARNHPGSAGGYSAINTQYDLMGRVMKQSNPAEINSSWIPAGDDAAGWLYTQQTYDWKGRPLVTTNTDGAQKYASYSACGCAGSEVVTLTDEVGRQQKVYSDVLGRTAKTEVLNWDSSVYSTTSNTYNARDQVTLVRQYQGADTSSTYQDTTMTYDGYGRLLTKHVPEQNAGTSTVYAYNTDDSVQSVTDARGASATYSYNGRHLVTGINYSAPAGITPTSNVSFGYDAAGNRTSMTDGLGSMTYSYDQLSRLTSETRYFSALSNSANGGNYGISYQYNLANELTSITDPFGAQIGYTRDTVGRTTAVTGSGFANVSAYVSNIQYRAWGGVKAASYGNNSVSTTAFNNRLQPVQFRLTDANSGASYISENYAYWGDGRLQSVADLDDTAGNNPPATLRFLSRSYGYDQAGRVAQGYSSNTAPFNQTYGYDEFDNLTSRAGSYYWQPYQSATFTYTNNRHNGWSYDADGQVSSSPATTTDDAHNFYYDAAGRLSRTIDTATNRTVDYRPSYDGDGKLASEWSQITQNGYPNPATSSYIARSTVIGEILTRLNQSGNKSATNVRAEGLLFASQGIDYQGSPYVGWTQRNPLGITETGKGVYDPLGNYIPFQQHDDPRPPAGSYNSSSMSGLSASMSNPNDYGMGCFVDAVPTNCNRAMAQVNSGSAYVSSIVSRYGNGIVTELGLTFEQHNVRVGREVQLATSLRFFRNLVPGSQSGIGGEPQNTDQTYPPIDLFRNVFSILSDQRCSDFISGLIDTAGQLTGRKPYSYDAKELVWALLNEDGEYGYGFLPGDYGGGGAGGDIFTATAIANIGGLSPQSGATNRRGVQLYYALTLIHETIHLAGGGAIYRDSKTGAISGSIAYYTDEVLARAAQILTKAPGFPRITDPNDPNNVTKWGEYWDKQLKEHCTPDQFRR